MNEAGGKIEAARNDVTANPQLIDTLSASDDPNKSAQGFELGALSAIYPSVRLHHPSPSRPGTPASSSSGSDRVRFVVTLQPEDGTTPEIEVLVSLPEEYPEYAPTLQLLGKYVGSYAVDAGLCEYPRPREESEQSWLGVQL